MNKHQLACEAVLHWDEVAQEARERMLSCLKQFKGFTPTGEKGRTRSILAKKYKVSSGYVGCARKLFLEDKARFFQVHRGEEFLPIVRPKKFKNKEKEMLSLYRVFGKNNELLYIGKTWNVGQRMDHHAENSDWWDEFATMTVQRGFETYEDLTKAETLAIRQEKPKYNLEAKMV